MNRREFCLSLGAVAAGGTVAAWGRTHVAAVIPYEPVSSAEFRAKMLYREQWRDRFAHLPFSDQAKHLREELHAMSGRLDALVLNDRENLSPEFLGMLEAESSYAGLELYVPSCFPLSAAVWNPASMQIHALSLRDHVIHRAETEPGLLDGFVFVMFGDEKTTPVRGIVLCDRSRCRWRIFLCHRLHHVDEVLDVGLNDIQKLQTAQWLDMVQKRHCCS